MGAIAQEFNLSKAEATRTIEEAEAEAGQEGGGGAKPGGEESSKAAVLLRQASVIVAGMQEKVTLPASDAVMLLQTLPASLKFFCWWTFTYVPSQFLTALPGADVSLSAMLLQVARATLFLPGYDQRLANDAVTGMHGAVAEAKRRVFPPSSFTFKARKSPPTSLAFLIAEAAPLFSDCTPP